MASGGPRPCTMSRAVTGTRPLGCRGRGPQRTIRREFLEIAQGDSYPPSLTRAAAVAALPSGVRRTASGRNGCRAESGNRDCGPEKPLRLCDVTVTEVDLSSGRALAAGARPGQWCFLVVIECLYLTRIRDPPPYEIKVQNLLSVINPSSELLRASP